MLGPWARPEVEVLARKWPEPLADPWAVWGRARVQALGGGPHLPGPWFGCRPEHPADCAGPELTCSAQPRPAWGPAPSEEWGALEVAASP